MDIKYWDQQNFIEKRSYGQKHRGVFADDYIFTFNGRGSYKN